MSVSAMYYTVLAFVAVLATRFLTALRLKDMKGKLDGIKPHIDELRAKIHVLEEEHANLQLKQEATQTRLTHLKGVVEYMEATVKSPANSSAIPDERQQVLEAAEEVS